MSEEKEEYKINDLEEHVSFDYQLKTNYDLLYSLVYLQRKIIIICILPISNKDQNNNFKLSTIFYNHNFKMILCPELMGFNYGISTDKEVFIQFCEEKKISFLIP